MFARIFRFRKQAAALLMMASVAACGNISVGGGGSGGVKGPQIEPGQPVRVALLIPKSDSSAAPVARSLENAARLSIASLQGAKIDLKVYDTAGTTAGAASAAQSALADNAQIIVGPLYSQSIGAITPVIASQNLNILSLSNNASVAGGNVFVMGQTFDDTANRLVRFAKSQGKKSVAVVHGGDVSGLAGRDAIVKASQGAGLKVATVQGYTLSQESITGKGPAIAAAIKSSGAETVFLTASVNADLPLISTTLPENGVSPSQTPAFGLTRWNAIPEALALPGLQGGFFTLPDTNATNDFENRYRAAYGSNPHPIAGLSYDALQAIGTLAAAGRRDAVSGSALTRSGGFRGAYGAFRLKGDGTTERALAVAQVRNNSVAVISPAPSNFGRAGF
ncbi:penicillin-binding protein activator [Palleronia caenipelagi]|uniref:Penicillin-binding protein activator n=1 Tax=Palleronia caenipelagi TaxID=2489174 RepID=A0A547Q7D3_9RHOB|nr:penicillin-binding protein activator [Palleronia caenipelagi]TRD22297.1 penicillin-binding protein activator [Palleronia caenipelagi]